MKRNGNPSTPGPGLRAKVRKEQAVKARQEHDRLVARKAAALAAMAKGVR